MIIKLFKLSAVFIFLNLLIPTLLFALTLDQAKSQGLVGEKLDGYLGAVKKSPEVSALIKEINSKRRANYLEIAAKRKTSIQAVEALAGKKAIENTASGNYIQTASGDWVKK